MLWGQSPRENDMKLKVGIVDDWRSFWKMHSLYVFVFIGAIPDLWNLVVASGLLNELPVGERLDLLIKWGALLGAMAAGCGAHALRRRGALSAAQTPAPRPRTDWHRSSGSC